MNEMRTIIKDLYETFYLWRKVKNSAGLLKVTMDIFKFAESVSKGEKPMVCEIALCKMGDGTKVSDFVNLWAAVGEANPIKRIEHLKHQNNVLKLLLEVAKSGNINDTVRKDIETALKTFE